MLLPPRCWRLLLLRRSAAAAALRCSLPLLLPLLLLPLRRCCCCERMRRAARGCAWPLCAAALRGYEAAGDAQRRSAAASSEAKQPTRTSENFNLWSCDVDR